MTQKLNYLLTFFAVILLTTVVFAKPRGVNLNQELQHAKFVGMVVIDRYDVKGNIYFHSTEYEDTIKRASVNHYTKEGGSLIGDTTLYMTAFWPYTKSTVLIVIDSTNRVSLFAKVVGDQYRFWSPIHTRSVALFSFLPPATPLNAENSMSKQGEYERCWDGCYLPVDRLRMYYRD